MKLRALVPFFLLFAPAVSFALSSAAGASQLDTLTSTSLMSIPSVGIAASSASNSTINPAAAGGVNFPIGEVFFAGLADLTQPSSYIGSDFLAGGVFPTDYGVYSASARFVTSALPLELGTFGSVNLSISKRLYQKLLVGAGVGFTLGVGNRFDWGLGLNLGFIDTPGSVWILKDFSWGAAIDGIGKPFAPYSGYASFPPSLTPALGAGFAIIKSRPLTVRLSGEVSFPSFQDVRLGFGGNVSLGGAAILAVASSLDLKNLSSSSQAFPLSAGVEFDFRPSAPAKLSRVRPSIAAEPLASNVYAFGGGLSATFGRTSLAPPHIQTNIAKTSYISPNGDGVKDALVVPLDISDSAFIVRYRLTVRSSDGAVVRIIRSPSLSVASGRAAGFFDRLFYVKGGVPVPKEISWNGRNDQGKIVADGVYSYTISAQDSNGNSAETEPATVVVDTQRPSVHATLPAGTSPIISPDGDGYKDTLKITQTGSTELRWTGRFMNAAGKVVRTLTWSDSSPKSFIWDGRGTAGTVLPDGVYHYVVSSTDKAGNTSSATIPSITLDTARPTVGLDVSTDAISPGTSSPLQSVRYEFVVPDKSQVESWKLVILDSAGNRVRTTEGGGAVPPSFTFDGTGAGGNQLPDGAYHAELSVVYRNGSHSNARAAVVEIDRTAPSATVSEEYHAFSPIGSGDRTTMVFHVSASTEPVWNGTIANGGGTIVRSYEWHGAPPSTVSWNGRSAAGRVEPDGVYQFSVSSTDAAGNFGQSNVVGFVLDTQHKQLLVSTNYDAFSPNGVRNIIQIIPDVRSPKGLQSYRIAIENRSGTVVGSFQGTGAPTGPFAWNGLEAGRPVPAGRYRAVITGRYASGVIATANTAWFSVVTSLPHLSVASNYRVFSPNGDGYRDTVTFEQQGRGGTAWKGQILSDSGKVVLEEHWHGTLPREFTWDGTDSLGNRAANGSYSYTLSTVDRAGNTAQATISGIVVDDRPTQVYIDSETTGFSPNGDGILDTVVFRIVEKPAVGISSWRVEILSAEGTPVRTWIGSGTPPSSTIVWNGSTTSGVAPDGRYTARLRVHYLKGDVDTSTTVPFLLVASPPSVVVHLSPLPFVATTKRPATSSARLEFHITVHSLDAIAHWRLEVYSPAPEEPFHAFSGEGQPPSVLSWDGRGEGGKAVTPGAAYSYHLTVVDSLGNRTLVTGTIPIAPSISSSSK